MYLIGADNMEVIRGNEKKASGVSTIRKRKKKPKRY